MSSTGSFLKSRLFVFSVGLVFLLVLIWLVFYTFLDFSAMTCVVITCVVLILFMAYVVWAQAKAAKSASNLEKSIWEQSEEQKAGVRPEKREEIENLRQQLVASIQKLKKSKLGHGRSGAAALYALPWYMIIGPPAAGKTTAIRNSGLEFPFGTDREIQGVGGTRNCDWWFSNSAIILDTAGRYITEEEDQEEWLAFLDILRKNRRRQPINGVLVCISIADLLNASNEDTEWHAKTVRKRIDELTQRLGLRFPVYLVFTKCDLFNGFVEFFGEFSRTQREQIWGCSFSNDQLDNPNPKALFDNEFQVLYEGLLSARFARLSPGIRREDRGVIFAFPMEFLSAKEKLSFFVSRVFQQNPYQESPVFRGFYFTSGTQEGVPIDRVLQSIAKAAGLTPEMTQQFNPEMQTKSYFIKDLFTEVLIPDERLVQLNSKTARNKRIFKVGSVAGIAVALLLVILAVANAYFRSKGVIEATEVSTKEVNSLIAAHKDVEGLDASLRLIHSLQDRIHFGFGMDRSGTLLESVEKSYFQRLTPVVESQFLQPLRNRLRDFGRSRSDLFDDLRAYMLVTKAHEKLGQDTMQQSFLKEVMSKTVSPQSASALHPHIGFFAAEFSNAVEKNITQPFSFDEQLVGPARAVAGKHDVSRIYQNLQRSLGAFADYIPPSQVFDPTVRVRGVFTRDALIQYEQKITNRDYEKLSEEEKWVLGYAEDQMQGLTEDKERVADSLRTMYYRDYADEWWKFLLNVRLLQTDNLRDATNQLKLMTDSRTSLVRKLFDDVLANTRFDKSTFEAIKEKAGIKGAVHPIEAQFRLLHEFIAGSQDKEKQSELDGLIGLVAQTAEELDGLAEPKKAKDFAQEVLKDKAGGSLGNLAKQIQASLRSSDDGTRRAIAGLFMQSLRSSWKTVLVEAAKSLNADWQEQVVTPYKLIAKGYPFDPSSPTITPSQDIAQIFGDGGAFSTYLTTDLRPFFESGDSWEGRKWEGEGLNLSPSGKDVLKDAGLLSQAIFKGKELGMKVSITMERPVVPGNDVDKVCATFSGKSDCFEVKKEKTKTFAFDWPGSGGAELKLITERFLRSDEVRGELSFDGEWGLFKLIDQSRRSGDRSATRCTWTFKDNISLTATIRTIGSPNPFVRSLRIALPETLL